MNSQEVNAKESPFKFVQEHPDRYLWALAIAPVLCAFIESLAGVPVLYSVLVYLIPNITLSLLDVRELKKTGRVAPEHWTVLIVPVFIWQRLKLNGQGKGAFWSWITAFVISLIISASSYESAVEDTACALVTDILHNQFYQKDTDCVGVTIDEEVKDAFYKATATLTNGSDLFITIDAGKGDEIYVRIPRQ